MLQMSKNRNYENLYTTYRVVNNTQVQRTDLKIVVKDRIIGTLEADDMGIYQSYEVITGKRK